MANLFDMDKRDLRRLYKWYRRSPKEFARATGLLLNNFAFGVRLTAIEAISTGMIVRDFNFIQGSLKVERSHTRLPISTQVSRVGSITRNRFTGWIEQETGQRTKKERTFQLAARRGSKKRRAVPRARLRPGTDFITPAEYSGKSDHHRAVVMLQTLAREGYKQPFIVGRHKRLKSGLYKFGRGRKPNQKLIMLQNFDPSNPQPRRYRWMRRARQLYFNRIDIRNEWYKMAKYLFKKR